jgi:hypothetical protein
MKNNIYLIALLLIGSLISSCDSDDLDYQNDFDNSTKVWLDFKESTNNSYNYKVVSGSWTGTTWETTIKVSKGVITERHFKYTVTEGLSDDVSEEDLEWTENENQIGTHQNGAEPMTLDEIYNKAQQDWLVKRENTTTFFEKENNGMISICGYVQNNCTDGCFVGIRIKSIEPL